MSIIFTFVKRCLLLGILFFALLGFQGKADALEAVHWSEDFRTNYDLGDGKAQIESKSDNNPYISVDSNALIKQFDGIAGLGCNTPPSSGFIYDPPVNVFNATDADAYSITFSVKANLLQNVDGWWNILARKSQYGATGASAQFKFSLADDKIFVRLWWQEGGTYQSFTYDTGGDTLFNIKIELNSLLLLNVYINGTLVIDSFNQSHLGSYHDIGHIRLIPGASSQGCNLIFNDFALTSGLPELPYYFADWCGNDAGKFLETTPTDLCDIGNASAVVFDGAKWSWDCVDGVVSQNCRSYISTTLPVDGVCGTWAGETFDVWPAKTQLCYLSASLIDGSMTETINGWSWGCAGFNGGSDSVCFADKGVGTLPVFPELPAGTIDDCDGLPLLEGLVCKIGNTIKQIFLPSSEKLNELNQTINKVSTKFPFSYISIATDTIEEMGVKINETGDFEMSLLGSEKKSIDFNRIPIAEHIKGFTTTLFILFFLFWLVRYIRHVF